MNEKIVWNNDKLKSFTKTDAVVNHNIHLNPLFSNDGLIEIIDKLPKEAVEVFTMGYNPTGWNEWFVGRRGNLDGKQLLDAVQKGRIWVNIRKVNHHNQEVAKLCEELFDEIEQKTGVKTYKHDLGLLISSPNAHVYYHADMPLVLLVQISGIKKVYLYEPTDPFISDKSREAIAILEHDEQLEFNPDWDNQAVLIHDLKPGEFLTWRQNCPHRIVNQDCVNVSLSIEYMTTSSAWLANLFYANGCLRRYFGFNPKIANSIKILEPLKIIFSRIIKLMGGYKGKKTIRQPVFSIDEYNIGQIIFDNPDNAPKKILN